MCQAAGDAVARIGLAVKASMPVTLDTLYSAHGCALLSALCSPATPMAPSTNKQH
jgi:hypothetical protein